MHEIVSMPRGIHSGYRGLVTKLDGFEDWFDETNQRPRLGKTPMQKEEILKQLAAIPSLTVRDIDMRDEVDIPVLIEHKEKLFTRYVVPVYTDDGISDNVALVWESPLVVGPNRDCVVEVRVGKLDWVTKQMQEATLPWKAPEYKGYEEALERMKRLADEKLPRKAAKQFKSLIKPALFMMHGGDGNSRLGGTPDLPEDVPWPRAQGGCPYIFMGQIDLSEIPSDFEGKQRKLLPEKGVLSFWHVNGLNVQSEHEDALIDDIETKVFWFADEQLQRRELPADINDWLYNGSLKESVVTIQARPTVPAIDFPEQELRKWSVEEGSDEAWYDLCHELYVEYDDGNELHTVLGNAAYIQDSIETQPKDYGFRADQKILLAQFSSDDKIEALWGDNGRVYFFASLKDLRARDFSTVVSHMDCF